MVRDGCAGRCLCWAHFQPAPRLRVAASTWDRSRLDGFAGRRRLRTRSTGSTRSDPARAVSSDFVVRTGIHGRIVRLVMGRVVVHFLALAQEGRRRPALRIRR